MSLIIRLPRVAALFLRCYFLGASTKTTALGAISCAAILLFAGCEQNHYDTTITDAKVEAVERRIELKGDEWAIKELRKILKSEPSHWHGNLLLASLVSRGNPKNPEVQKLFDRIDVRGLPPQARIQATYRICNLLFDSGKAEAALKHAESMVKASVKESWPEREKQIATSILLECRLGVILNRREPDGTDATLEELSRFVEENPAYADGRTTYAALLRDAGRYDQAIQQFEKVIADSARPEVTTCRATMGLAKTYFAKGDRSKAKEYAQQAREIGTQLNAPAEFMDQHLKPIETAQ